MLLSQTPEDKSSLHIGMEPDWSKENDYILPPRLEICRGKLRQS